MFYEGVRKIVFVVAVRWDPIHKSHQNVTLTKTISLDTVHEMNL